MTATLDRVAADAQQTIAALQRQLDERTAERDEALQRDVAGNGSRRLDAILKTRPRGGGPCQIGSPAARRRPESNSSRCSGVPTRPTTLEGSDRREVTGRAPHSSGNPALRRPAK